MPLEMASGLSTEIEALAEHVVDSALEVRTILGRGLLERGYAEALATELRLRGFSVEREVVMPFEYKGIRIERAYRLDLWIERSIVIECKVVDELTRDHYGQVATYLRLANNRLGFLINFDAVPFGTGIKRLIR